MESQLVVSKRSRTWGRLFLFLSAAGCLALERFWLGNLHGVAQADAIIFGTVLLRISGAAALIAAFLYVPLVRKASRLVAAVARHGAAPLPRYDRWRLRDYALVLGFSVLVAILATLPMWNRATAYGLAVEDGLLEDATVLCYLAAAALNLRLLRRSRRRMPGLLVLTLLFVVVGMEEISWGQRILGFSTPAALDVVNVQHEASLHNIWSTSLVEYAALTVCVVLLAVLPLARARSRSLSDALDAIGLPVAPSYSSALLLIAVVGYVCVGATFGTLGIGPQTAGGTFSNIDDEFLEFFIACLFAGAALTGWQLRLPRRQRAARRADRSNWWSLPRRAGSSSASVEFSPAHGQASPPFRSARSAADESKSAA